MLFMVLVGGLGTFEGPIAGAVIFLLPPQELFGDFGVWYLAGLGFVAIIFALFFPDGLMGSLRKRTGFDPLPIGTRFGSKSGSASAANRMPTTCRKRL